ncbi:MAG: PAS domain S-box protein, partial [Bryobacterales bacterium]|nr:PAS domain S-box protein [Bryobacterales bacterium]
CLFDAETHRFLMVNQAAAKLLRYNKTDLEQMRVEDIRVDAGNSGEVESEGPAAPIGGGIWRIRRKDGAVRHVESFESRIEFGDVSGMLVLLTDVTSRLEMEQEVMVAKDRYQLLAARVMQMQEDERKHLSREIHDSLGQELASVRYQLEATQRVLGEKDNGLAVAVKTCDGLLARLREIASSLRPPVLEHLNVAEAIDWLVDQYSRRTKIQFRRLIPLEFPEAPDEVKLAVFRICQESLTNISRHSRATQAVVSVTLRAEFELRIEDNGVGFLKPEAQKRSLGLLGMRERSEQIGGRLQVDSSPGAGTTVSLRVPREVFRTHDG